MDVAAGGRMEFGLGAGWKADEWIAYGYDFPATPARLKHLGDALEITTRMLNPGRATYSGATARVDGAINVPKGLQHPRVPIIVGGNGREVTWRLAARYADELNLDNLAIADIADAMVVIRQRCAEVGRDPETLRVSVHLWWETLDRGDPVAMLRAYREAGVDRVMTLARSSANDNGALSELRDVAKTAGVVFASA
jgi:alkanesulfonate monooxygenase SsuD/methylene tetrahydromethanopterin reductase-like flavin-dependent oxidoreductase (luciferase family)